MNSYIEWGFPISEADGDHRGESRFMEARRRPGSHYIVMRPLKTSFVAAGMDKMSREQPKQGRRLKNNLFASELLLGGRSLSEDQI